ncbi:MAG: hypothetical protein AAGC78_02815 [Cellvibrio sp.]|uniref:hypothetical protein n=1 Tax=Cellvibrio sp. TaxID=1965322 RepID=UPI0031A5E4B8
MINQKYLYIAACSALFISGCGTQPTAPSGNSLEIAATQVLNEAVYHSALFSTCAELGGDIELDVIDIQQDWLNENSKLIAAADSYYSQQHANHTFNYDGKTLAPAAIRLAREARTRAINELALAQRSPANKQKTCKFRIAQISGSNLPLANIASITPYASELLMYLPLDIKAAEAPQLAAGLIGTTPGATYYSIAKVHEKSCPAAYTLSITNQWPNEAYANFCGEKATEVLTCEWGKCTSKKL